MNILTDYNAIAERLYTERMKRGRTLSEDIYREWYLSLSLSSLAGIEQERKNGTFDEQQYKTILLNTFESCMNFLDHLSQVHTGNENIIYLQNVGRVIESDFYKFVKQDEDIPPALLPFLDTVETLRQLSYILTGPNITDSGKYKYPCFWAFCTVNMNSVNKMNYTEHFEMNRITDELTGKKEDLIIPTEEEVNNAMAFLNGPLLTFMYDHFLACGPQSIETLLIYPIFTTDPNEPVFPLAPRPGLPLNARPVPTRAGIVITPEECYSEEQRNRYMEELQRLEQKRDENALLLLEQADQSSFDADKDELFPANIPGAVLPELVIFYKILQTVLPQDKTKEELERIGQNACVFKPKKINYPVDKVNRKVWKYIEFDMGKQLAVAVEKMNTKKEISIMIGIDFGVLDGVKISKKLTQFDKRVYVAVSALFNAGNRLVTLTQIHYAMGNTVKPSKNQIEKINEAVTKMKTATFYIDNLEEIQNHYKYDRVHYDGPLLPSERVTATINGQMSDAVIHIFREPPLMTFARKRNQITTFEAKLLQSPISKTESNLAIEDYLLDRIAMAKRTAKQTPKRTDKKEPVIPVILLETLYDETNITTYKQKARATEKIKAYLQYYVQCKFIKKFEIKPDRIIFTF